MKKIILRFYNVPEKTKKRFNLNHDIRYIAYDYINKKYFDAGLPEEHTTKNEFLKNNKCKFTRKKEIPLF